MTQSFAFEKERSLQHTYTTLSLSLLCVKKCDKNEKVCVCTLPLTTFILLLKREGEEETKKGTPPPKKKLPGAPNLGFHNFFLGFYFVCVFFGSWKGHSSAKIVLCIPLINYVEFITRT